MSCTSIWIVGHGDGLGSAIQSSVTLAGRKDELVVSASSIFAPPKSRMCQRQKQGFDRQIGRLAKKAASNCRVLQFKRDDKGDDCNAVPTCE